jgi:hypothetical protein
MCMEIGEHWSRIGLRFCYQFQYPKMERVGVGLFVCFVLVFLFYFIYLFIFFSVGLLDHIHK